MRTTCIAGLFLGLGLLGACMSLPDVDGGMCGNRVVEASNGESCDSVRAVNGFQCIAPGEPYECHYRCKDEESTRDGGTASQRCPEGYACGKGDEVCRSPVGQFVAPELVVAKGGTQLLAADMDGNDTKDLISVGEAATSVHYLDDSGRYLSSVEVPSFPFRPAVTNLDGKGPEDLILNLIAGIGAFEGQNDRTLRRMLFGSYALPPELGTILQVLVADIQPARLGDENLLVFQHDDKIDLLSISSQPFTGVAVIDGWTIPGGATANLGEPVAAAKVRPGDPCVHLFLAIPQSTTIEVFRPCPAAGVRSTIPLPANRRVWGELRLGDVDGDGDEDLIVGSTDAGGNHGYEIFSFDDGNGFQHLRSIEVREEAACSSQNGGARLYGPVLEIVDIDGDGRVDLIDGRGALRMTSTGPVREVCAAVPLWNHVVAGRFNADPFLDLAVIRAVGSETTVDVLIGTGTGWTNTFSFPMDRPVQRLFAADLDGDVLDDVLVWQTPGDSQPARLSVLFGRAAGGPEPLTTIGDLDAIQRITVGRSYGADGISDISIVSGSPGSVAFSLIPGDPSRHFLSPFVFEEEGAPAGVRETPVRIAGGEFTGDGLGDVAVLTARSEDDTVPGKRSFSLWLAAATPNAGFVRTRLEQGLSMQDGAIALAIVDLDEVTDPTGKKAEEAVIFYRGPDRADQGSVTDRYIIVRSDDSGVAPIPQEVHLGESLRLTPESRDVPAPLRVIDVDGDGKRDIALATSKSVVVFWNEGNSTLGGPTEFSLAPSLDKAKEVIEVMDFDFIELDGDRARELVILTSVGLIPFDLRGADAKAMKQGERPSTVMPFKVVGAPQISISDLEEDEEDQTLSEIPGGRGGLAFLCADVDRDGLDDIVVAKPDGIFLLRARQQGAR
ncbi:FG-GAP repeat domain-containing protein [Chondromyces crocatus]|uniref:VCBS repeat-containing protein n=1 Tax=Chondromyces crocatus TaxID=52 RepID=A0A0K1E8H1_CHOCO|nr:VCBS repeat-containing protein [Chondromyces crocatus]AKT37149.1 uncharacterized protein CMC5_012790 [Chondromyces crocatus]